MRYFVHGPKELFYSVANYSRYIFEHLVDDEMECHMDIILQGQHNADEMVQSFERVLKLFKERYQVDGFREIHLTVTLVDEQGDEVELIDSDSNQAYRIFEVYRQGYELAGRKGIPLLKLVIDNTHK